MSFDALQAKVHQFHEVQHEDAETGPERAERRSKLKELKTEIIEILEALGPEDASDELDAFLDDLTRDTFVLVRRYAVAAHDRVHEFVRAPPPLSVHELVRLALEGEPDEVTAWDAHIELRGEEATEFEKLARHVHAVRFGAEPIPAHFTHALRPDRTFEEKKLVLAIAEQLGWVGVDRYFLHESGPRYSSRAFRKQDTWIRNPRDHYIGMRPADLNQRLGDPTIHGFEYDIRVAKVFGDTCSEAIELARERHEAFRNAWDVLTSSDFKVVDEFLEQYRREFPAPEPTRGVGNFRVKSSAEKILVGEETGGSFLKAETPNDLPIALAYDAARAQVLVGTDTGVYVFDENGELIEPLPGTEGMPVVQIATHGDFVAVVQTFRVVVVDRSSGEITCPFYTGPYDRTAGVAWSLNGALLAKYGLGLDVLDVASRTSVFSEGRAEEEWKETMTFAWVSENEFQVTTRVTRNERGKTKTRLIKIGRARNKNVTNVLTHAAAGQGIAVSATRGDFVTWRELGKGGKQRHHTFDGLRALFVVDGTAYASTSDGLWRWDEEPVRVGDRVTHLDGADGRLFAIRDSTVVRLDSPK